MVKDVVWLLDYENNYPPIWEASAPTTKNAMIISMLFLVYWIFIYYRKYLNYKVSVLVGTISSLLFLYLYYIQYQYAYSPMSTTQNKWVYNYTTLNDVRTNISSIKTNKSIDIKKDGYVVSMEYFEKLKNRQKTSPMDKYGQVKEESKAEVETNQDSGRDKLHSYLVSLLVFKAENLGFQGFCLITILFTILSLTWNINKVLFKRIFSLFLQALAISIPFTFLWYWFYSTNHWLTMSNIKMACLFVGVSITLSILTEILSFYSTSL